MLFGGNLTTRLNLCATWGLGACWPTPGENESLFRGVERTREQEEIKWKAISGGLLVLQEEMSTAAA